MGNAIGKILIFIGKPFYFILSRCLIALLFLFYSARKVCKTLLLWPKTKLFPVRLVVFATSLILILVPFWYFILRGLPSPRELTTREREVSTKIYDRNGVLLYKIYKDKNRTPISLDKVPVPVRLATLAAEDAEFYSHPGYSVKGILRSVIKNIKQGELTGGSTITQQLVKNTLLTPEKTIVRKIKELILAIEVESIYSKDQILEMYLNETPYGGVAYGIQEASREYFEKEVGKLTLAEAAFLAGLPKSPTKLSPFGPNPELAYARQKEVLHLMRINKFINAEQEQETLGQEIVIKQKKTEIKAPHFVMYVRQELVDKYGEDVVETGGLEVFTTLDIRIQNLAEQVVKEEIEKLKGFNVTNGAVLVFDTKSGEILAMVGSKDYFDIQNDGNVNVTLRLRQPGSSIKVINYAYALSNGFTPSSIIDDSPVVFKVPGLPPYRPQNYDSKYRGKITLRSALAESRNIPAVKILSSYGVSKMLELGQKMGITTWNDPSNYGLSLTLGGGDVKLIDLAQVYLTIANYGKKPAISPIINITNYKGRVLEQTRLAEDVESRRVIDPRVAFLLTDILKDNVARSPAFGSNSYLVIPNHPEIAVKTGTSNNLKDNLTLGFNQKYLVAVWVGNNNSTPMARIASGVTGASPIWNKIMRGLNADEKTLDWEIPEGLIRKNCFGKEEWFLKENVPTCILSPVLFR
ncbi:MAG: transglycosylase domain-containing protein [bacterium]|nr:transglycosylase domain-containing protein [bacterium]